MMTAKEAVMTSLLTQSPKYKEMNGEEITQLFLKHSENRKYIANVKVFLP